jgi:hypothetical protein
MENSFFKLRNVGLIYSVEAKVDQNFAFEWKDNAPAKYGGDGTGTLTFASGDKCTLSSVINTFTGGYGGRFDRCAARIVPGGSWLKFEGEFYGAENDEQNKFHLDSFSDTEYIHTSGSDKVSLTLKAGSQVDFDDNGRLKAAYLGRDAQICSSSGGTRLFLGNSTVYFDEQGCARDHW